MPGKMVAITRSVTGLLVAGIVMQVAVPAHAAQPPFPNKRVTIVASGKSLPETLKDLFSQTGLNVKISSAISGGTNGKWTDTPAEIWRQLSRANNLVAYYDGSVVRIYSASEITSRTINAADPKAVEAQAARLGLTGTGNSVKAGKNVVIASGVPAFLERITELASRAAAPVAAPPPVIASAPPVVTGASKAPMDSDIVSPINKAPVSAAPRVAAAQGVPLLASEQPYELSYSVSRPATSSYPYEIRIYNLKWTKPNDKIINAGDFDVIIPGVATLLRQVMGGGSARGVEIVQRGTQGTSQYSDGPPMGPYGPAPYGYPAPYQQQQQAQQPAASPDSPSITANPAGNGVIVVDRPAKMGNYDALVRNFDRPRSHVEIDVMFVDIATSSEKNLGIEWDVSFGGLGGVFSGTSSLGGGGSGSNITGSFSKGNTLGIMASISALSKKGRAQVMTRSNLTTLENEPAVSDNRTTVPVRFSGQYQGGIRDYRVGVFTAIAPQVAKDADGLTINMQLDIRTGSINGFQPDGTPFFNQGLLTNSVSIRQGESVIVSGLTIESEFEDSSKIPVLGDIPAAGQLFRKKNKGKSRIERVMIVTPRVQSMQANTIAASNVEEEDEEEAEELSTRKKSKKRAPKKKTARTST